MKTHFNQFILLWVGQFISGIGGGLTSFGLGVYVFEKTGSAAAMGLVTLTAFLPSLLLSVPAGMLADRYDRRLLMMIGDGCSALGIIYILLMLSRGDISVFQICIGVGLSSIFASLLEPSYKATISDLLSEEDYSKASGLVSLASSSRYLLSPMIAGLLLSKFEISLLLVLDIATFVITIFCTGIVRSTVEKASEDKQISLWESLNMGWTGISKNRGVMTLAWLSLLMTCAMGVMQVLAEPLILSFSSSKVLGVSETICASGMLVSGLYLGMVGIKRNFVKILSLSLGTAGLAMVLFGYREEVVLICLAGFLFFSMLPLANNCLDYIVRIHIPTELQGRAWGLIGFISQMGYVIAFCFSGIVADQLGSYVGLGVGRGAGYTIMISGIGLVGIAVLLCHLDSIRQLDIKEVSAHD